jgi:hypothetical protein
MIRRLIGYLILLALIAYVGSQYIAPIVMCWQDNGTYDNFTQTCSVEIPAFDPTGMLDPFVRDTAEQVMNRIDPQALRELIITVPNAEETPATLARTNDALARFIASFPQPGTDIEGYVEARGAESVTDEQTGLVLVPFFVNYGGSGSFVYVGLFRAGTSSMDHVDSLMVGDRISVDQVQFERSGEALKAVVLYKDRGPNDAMAAVPSIPKKLVAPIQNDAFGEPDIFDRTVDYPATYKDLLKIEAPAPNAQVSSPITVRGMARGPWFFEASFPITVTDQEGTVLGTGVAQAVGDWMTEDYVPFTATVAFTNAGGATNGSLILNKDNPSGLPEKDDSYTLPVTFK